MPRPPGPDPKKVEKIIDVLRESKNGLWVMEIARRSGIPKSTVHRYLRHYLANWVEEVTDYSGLVKVYRLKKNVKD